MQKFTKEYLQKFYKDIKDLNQSLQLCRFYFIYSLTYCMIHIIIQFRSTIMHNNLNTQALKQWFAKLNETAQKIEIEVSDGVTYVGQLSLMPGMNVQKLIDKIQKAEAEIIVKTTTKMEIEIGFIPVTLYSAQSLEIMQLKTKIVDLETEIKQLKNQVQWKMEDLDSKNNFDLNYIYQIYLNGYGGCSILNTWTLADKLEFSHGATLHTVFASNKRHTNHGVQINKIIKKQL